jgi:hypothetical protein
MTIFGFNTDVKQGEQVYHVQSEARQNDLLFETQVFVKGQCIGKKTVSYAQRLRQPEFSDAAMQELLKAQHKSVLEAIQQNALNSVLAGDATEIQDINGAGLSIKWVAVAESADGSSITLHFQVLDSGQPVSGAEVMVFPCIAGAEAALTRGATDSSGTAGVFLQPSDQVMRDRAVIVEAKHGGKSATRKLRFKK